MEGKLSILTEINLGVFLETIKKTESLEGKILFYGLSQIATEKKKLKDALEQVEKVELEAKQAINDKAKALLGEDWQAIKGDGYKITRSFTGAVYEISDEDAVKPDYIKVVVTPNTDEIDNYRKDHSKLPDGISLNPYRGESIRITVDQAVENKF